MTCESRNDFGLGCEIGIRIRHHRWMLGVPRPALAEAVGLDIDDLIAVESGEASVSRQTLIKIAAALGVAVDSLAGDAGHFDLAPAVAALGLPVESVIRRRSPDQTDEAVGV